MFTFKETSENLSKALQESIVEVLNEYRPQLKQDINEAIEKTELSLGTVANESILKLSSELNQQIRCVKEGMDDSIRLTKSEMTELVEDSLASFRKTVVIPMLLFYLVGGMVLAGVVGFWMGRGLI